MNCKTCGNLITSKYGKIFCSRSCSITHRNINIREQKFCKNCNLEILNVNGKGTKRRIYCSKTCQQLYQSSQLTELWLDGKDSGLNTNGVVKPFVKEWLRKTRGNACEKCGWNSVNPHTGKIPLVADHIDGIWQNNRPENLQLICPNCDSLQSTYKAANVGKGRPHRRIKHGSVA